MVSKVTQHSLPFLVGIILICCCFDLRGDTTLPSATTDLSAAELAHKFPSIHLEQISPGPVPWLFEITLSGSDVIYVSADGRFLLRGDIVDLDSERNLTREARATSRARELAQMEDKNAIVVLPESEKFLLNVFIDLDCDFCREFHHTVDQLAAQGVIVRYFLYPANGPGSDGWEKALLVVCADDRLQAITDAFEGHYSNKRCDDSLLLKHFELANSVGIQGTPMLITSNGDYIGGFLSVNDIISKLRDLED